MTTDKQSVEWADTLKIKHFRGVYAKDELKKQTPNKEECGIINLDNSSGDGTHWTLYHCDEKQKVYYSSFGDPISNEAKDYLYKIDDRKILCSDFKIQDFTETCCGELCILILF